MAICSEPGCEKRVQGHGLCPTHYSRWRKYGDASAGARLSPRERFLKHAEVGDPEECWLWTGPLTGDGYGQLALGRRKQKAKAHRYAYQLWVGPIPTGTVSHHLCREKRCVNPAHIQFVKRADHPLLDDTAAARHAAKTRCLRGHPFSEENTYVDPRGRRTCRECARIRDKRRGRRDRRDKAARRVHDPR